MSIDYSSATRTFFLHSGETTYAMKDWRTGYLAHLYWGPRVSHRSWISSCRSVSALTVQTLMAWAENSASTRFRWNILSTEH